MEKEFVVDKKLNELNVDFDLDRTREKYIALLEYLKESCVYVPQVIDYSNTLNKKVLTQDDVVLRSNIIEAPTGDQFIACYTLEEEIPEDFQESFSIMVVPFKDVMKEVFSNKDTHGVVIDPYSHSTIIDLSTLHMLSDN